MQLKNQGGGQWYRAQSLMPLSVETN